MDVKKLGIEEKVRLVFLITRNFLERYPPCPYCKTEHTMDKVINDKVCMGYHELVCKDCLTKSIKIN